MADQTRNPAAPAIILAGGLVLVLLEWGIDPGPAASGTLWSLHLLVVSAATWMRGWKWGVAVAGGVLFAAVVAASAGGAMEGGIRDGDLPTRSLLLALGVYGTVRARKATSEDEIRFDENTGLVPGRLLSEMVDLEIERAQRYGRPFTLACIAIDNLPSIRKRAGAEAAEEAMRRFTHLLKGRVRSVDVLARRQDREFALLLPETGAEAAGVVLERIRRTLEQTMVEEAPSLSFTIGATTWVMSELSGGALHQRTYQLMFAARRDPARIRHEVLSGEAIPATPAEA